MALGTGSYGTSSFGGSGGTSSSSGSAGPGFAYTPTTGTAGSLYLFVEVDFSQAVEGIGSGATVSGSLWGAAVWDTDEWANGVTWTDVTPWVANVDISAGFSHELTAYTAGRMSVQLDNADGRFSPDNTDSPYRVGDSTAIGVLRPIRVRGVYLSAGPYFIPLPFTLFTGNIETWNEDYTGVETATVSVTAVDPFAQLAAFDGYAQTLAGAGDTYSQRIERILTNAGWTGPRFIDTGGHTFQATTLAQNAVTELKLTADSEGGAVWVGPDGSFYADGQNALLEKARSNAVQTVFSNAVPVDLDDLPPFFSVSNTDAVSYDLDSLDIAYDGSQVKNMAAYARVGSTVQLAVSTPSRVLYGDRQDERSDLICETDAQVLSLAERHVALYQEPERRIESLSFSPWLQPTAARVNQALTTIAGGGLSLRTLVRLHHTTANGHQLYRYLFVRGIKHKINGTDWRVTVEFSSATVWQQLVGSEWDEATWGANAWAL